MARGTRGGGKLPKRGVSGRHGELECDKGERWALLGRDLILAGLACGVACEARGMRRCSIRDLRDSAARPWF